MSLGDVSVGGSRSGIKDEAVPRGEGFSLSAAAMSAAAIFRVPLARRGAGVGAFVLAIVTAGALAHVGVRLKGLEVAYDLGHERRVATEMEEQRRRLQIEIGMLKDPRRVIAIARDRLNMGPPAPEAIWRLGAGRTINELPVITAASSSATPVATGASAKGPLAKRTANAAPSSRFSKSVRSSRSPAAVTSPMKAAADAAMASAVTPLRVLGNAHVSVKTSAAAGGARLPPRRLVTDTKTVPEGR